MKTTTMLTLAIMYLVPLGLLAWLYSMRPGYALIAVTLFGAIFGVWSVHSP